jgi:hypothetical protein
LEQQEKIDFDELSVRLVEEESKINGTGSTENGKIAMYSASKRLGNKNHQARVDGPLAVLGYQCYECGKYGHMKRECLDFIARKRDSDSSEIAIKNFEM